jgi:hypothetical protein
MSGQARRFAKKKASKVTLKQHQRVKEGLEEIIVKEKGGKPQ